MPIKSITASPEPGYMVQICAACGAEHTISFDRGAQKARTGPIALELNDTLTIVVDGGDAVTVTFASSDFPNFAEVTATELAAKLNAALPGVQARDDAEGLLIESKATGATSSIEIAGGTALAALGFPTDGRKDPCVSRPRLGVAYPEGQLRDPNIILLRRCNDCGASESLVRTLDCAPAACEGTHFAEHRRAVNSLAEHCKQRGWSHPHVLDEHAVETARPADLLAGVLQGPVALPVCVSHNKPPAAPPTRGSR